MLPDPKRARVRVYATHSTHKSLSALRQASMIHVRDQDFNALTRDAFGEAFLTHTSTSPNQQLVASLDLARRQVDIEGFQLVRQVYDMALVFRHRVRKDRLISKWFRILDEADLVPEEFRASSVSSYRQVRQGALAEWNEAWRSDQFVLDAPRDAAMSELFQWDNMNHANLNRRGSAAGDRQDDPTPIQAFRAWMEGPIMPPEGPVAPPPSAIAPPPGPGFPPPHGGPGPMPPMAKHMGSLSNILHHFNTVWSRRQLPNVSMFHYTDYRADLVGELIRLAGVLGCSLGRDRAEELAQHATLNSMRARAAELAPESTEGIWRSNERFSGPVVAANGRSSSTSASIAATTIASTSWPRRICWPGRMRVAGAVIPPGRWAELR